MREPRQRRDRERLRKIRDWCAYRLSHYEYDVLNVGTFSADVVFAAFAWSLELFDGYE